MSKFKLGDIVIGSAAGVKKIRCFEKYRGEVVKIHYDAVSHLEVLTVTPPVMFFPSLTPPIAPWDEFYSWCFRINPLLCDCGADKCGSPSHAHWCSSI